MQEVPKISMALPKTNFDSLTLYFDWVIFLTDSKSKLFDKEPQVTHKYQLGGQSIKCIPRWLRTYSKSFLIMLDKDLEEMPTKVSPVS